MPSTKLPDLRRIRLALMKVEAELPHAWTEPTWHPSNKVGVEVRRDVVTAIYTLNRYLDEGGMPT